MGESIANEILANNEDVINYPSGYGANILGGGSGHVGGGGGMSEEEMMAAAIAASIADISPGDDVFGEKE